MKFTKIVSMFVLAAVSFFLGSLFTSRGYSAQQENPYPYQRPSEPLEDQHLENIPNNSGMGIVGYLGFVVCRVEKGTSAEKMGLQRGDIISRWNGQDIISIRDFSLMSQLEPGQPIKFDGIRANFQTGQHESFTAKGVTDSIKPSK
ncbi:MAG TPA: PDZ domain-containing protein [Blastocatellia bacterium]|nr:PDZ domain-containing protein [Blastocatellia bacterium]